MMLKVVILALSLASVSQGFAVPDCGSPRLDACTGHLLSMVKSDTPVPDTVEKVQTHCS